MPKELRPNDLVPRSITGASNNGLSPVFSFTQSPDTLPIPPAGYIVQITNAGALQVQCAGTFGNIIPVGAQILMPCSIDYLVKPTEKLCKNIVLSNGPTNTTQFTGFPANIGVKHTLILMIPTKELQHGLGVIIQWFLIRQMAQRIVWLPLAK